MAQLKEQHSLRVLKRLRMVNIICAQKAKCKYILHLNCFQAAEQESVA